MRFSHDRRGQSVVIGAVILFGFLIIGLSLYQATIVPQQNGQVEFEHYEAVQNDLIELRAGITTAGQADTSQYKTIRLGTAYPVRVTALNPPDPVGSIRTSDPYNITISNESGSTVQIPTRFIRYEPGYNEIQNTPIWYDASVLYVDARGSGGGIAVREDQNLVTDSGTLRLTAVQNSFTTSGTGRITLELYPADTSTKSLPSGNLTISVPTRLTGPEYWDTAEIPAGNYNGVTEDAYAAGVHELSLSATSETVRMNTVGIESEPAEGSVKQNVGPRGGTGGGADGGDGGPGDGSGGADGGDGGTGGDNPPFSFTEFQSRSDGVLAFSVRNIAGERINVTGFSINARALGGTQLDNGRNERNDGPEVVVEPQDDGLPGRADRNGNGPGGRYDADGTLYPLDLTASIADGEVADVSFVAIRGTNGKTIPLEGLEQTANEADADITVVLQFDDRPNQVFYFVRN